MWWPRTVRAVSQSASGLDYDAVRALRPDVIYVSSQGYGRGGPLGTAPAFGPMAAAFAGATWLWNHPGAPYPAGSSLEHPDHFAGRLLAIAVLARSEHRRRTGQGQYVELSQSEAAAFLLGPVYLEEPLTGHRAVQRGNASETACPHGVYPASGSDAWIAIAVADDAAWRRLCTALDWTETPELATLRQRLAVRDALDARVAAWTRERSAVEAAEHLQAAGVSAFPVQGPAEHRADPHLAARGALIRLDDPGVEDVLHVANPLRFARRAWCRPLRLRRSAPTRRRSWDGCSACRPKPCAAWSPTGVPVDPARSTRSRVPENGESNRAPRTAAARLRSAVSSRYTSMRPTRAPRRSVGSTYPQGWARGDRLRAQRSSTCPASWRVILSPRGGLRVPPPGLWHNGRRWYGERLGCLPPGARRHCPRHRKGHAGAARTDAE